MKQRIIPKSFFTFLLIIMALPLSAQPDFMLKLEEAIVNEGGTDHLHVTLSMAGSTAFDLGSCNLQFSFNTDISLDASPLVSYNLGALFATPTVTEPATNKASLNIVLYVPGMGKSIIETGSGWTELAVLRFDINNPSGIADLCWSYNGGTTETVVFQDDETTQIYVGNPASDLVNVKAESLPVEFSEINARWEDHREKSSIIQWETASEINTAFFTIQRSEDGEDWETLDRIDAAGFSVEPRYYEFFDETVDRVLSEIIYYQIKSVDLDGKESFTPIVSLMRTELIIEAEVYPTLFFNEININLPSEKDLEFQVLLFNTNGSLLRQFDVLSNENFRINNLEELPSGTYLLQIIHQNQKRVHKLIKQ